MSNVAINENNPEDTMNQVLALQEMTAEQLLAKAEELGVELQETAEQSEMIDALAAKISNDAEPEVETEVEHGSLFSMHSRTDAAKALIRRARNKVYANKEAGVEFDLFVKNRNGDSYQRRAPGVQLRQQNIEKVLDLVTPLEDGSQDEMFAEFKASPENFRPPVLVLITRRTQQGTYPSYIMLYLRRNQENLVETFL